MKIGLIVYRIGPSHGSLLQTYALLTVLQNLGHNVTIINRPETYSILQEIKRHIYRLRMWLRGNYRGQLFYKGSVQPIQMKYLNAFVDGYLRRNTITIKNEKDLVELSECGYDAFIVGSDQTWRPKYVQKISYYFLDFIPLGSKCKRLSYAASFGTNQNEYSADQLMTCKKLAQYFDAISVRESDGVELCRSLFDKNAQCVFDPTLLLDAEVYKNLAGVKGTTKTVAYSILDDSRDKLEVIEMVSNSLGLKKHRINAGISIKGRKLPEPSVRDWLQGILNSEFVVTDSFHATVFSIIFNKPFITIANKERGMSRFESLLDTFDLKDRLIFSSDDVSPVLLEHKIEWDKVNSIKEREADKSIEFLISNLR